MIVQGAPDAIMCRVFPTIKHIDKEALKFHIFDRNVLVELNAKEPKPVDVEKLMATMPFVRMLCWFGSHTTNSILSNKLIFLKFASPLSDLYIYL